MPIALPEPLADVLRSDPQPYLALFHAADIGTLLIVKVPAPEITHLRGPLPIGVRHELHAHPAAPVVRSLVTFADDPAQLLVLETFTNVADRDQAATMRALTAQDELAILLYDEALTHRLSKRVPFAGQGLRDVLDHAEALRIGIDPAAYDFDAAKAAVLEMTGL